MEDINTIMEKRPSKSVDNNFAYHPPKPGQAEIYQSIRDIARGLAMFIEDHCSESRERSLAMTNLEQAVMWANAAIARNE